jgi:hypothetical protein
MSCLLYGPSDLETTGSLLCLKSPTSKKNHFFDFFSARGIVNGRFYHLRGTSKVAEMTHTHTAGNDENAYLRNQLGEGRKGNKYLYRE